jgi:hypothetical protein
MPHIGLRNDVEEGLVFQQEVLRDAFKREFAPAQVEC